MKQEPNKHYQADADLADFVLQLPKSETHLHLEGSVSFEQLHAFDPQRYPRPPEFWHPKFRYDSFDHFQSMIDDWILPYHSSLERYQQTADYVFKRCLAQGCKYVETSIHLPAVAGLDCDGPDLLSAITDVIPQGLEVRLFGGLTHTDYATHGKLLESALGWEQLAGIDLHGPEYWPVDPELPDYWRRAKDRGKVTKAHAGEFMPAEFVGWVLDNLQVERIQHGVRAIESPEVLERIVTAGVVLDVCPISNLKLAVEGIDVMPAHPVAQLIEAGVCVTISTDDTFMFGNSLVEEYYALVEDLGFSRADLVQVARNGIETALLDTAQRNRIIAELDQIATTIESKVG